MKDGSKRMSFIAGPVEHKAISLAARAKGIKIPEFLGIAANNLVEHLNGDPEHQARVSELIEEDRKVLDQI